MRITLADVAQAAGVSLSTASRALTNASHPMSQRTRRAVVEAAHHLGYRPNLVARSLRAARSLTLGIIVETIASPFTPLIIRGIQDYIDEFGYHGIILNANWDPEMETAAIDRLSERQVDGFILVESYIRSSEQIAEISDKPHVFVLRLFNALCPASVLEDNQHGAYLAIQHLLGLGHRRIGFVNGSLAWSAAPVRQQGYVDALSHAGIKVDPRLISHPDDWLEEDGYKGTQQLLEQEAPPTAIFAGNDVLALGAIYAIQDAGMRVPQDIAVVGYDNRELTMHVRPRITTIETPCMEMGRISAKVLLKMIEGQMEEPDPILVPGRLIVRDSCGYSLKEAGKADDANGHLLRSPLSGARKHSDGPRHTKAV